MGKHKVDVGPASYENWRSALSGAPSGCAYECPLFSDAYFTGEWTTGLGPYELINTIPHLDKGVLRQTIVLRHAHYLKHDVDTIDFDHTDVSRYHGASLVEEIAALLSLSLGARLKAGGATRRFDGGDPRGRPVSYHGHEDPVLFHLRGSARVVPDAFADKCINDASLLARLPDLSPEQAVAIVRAARQYQEALWLVEIEPQLAWVMFVSAIEIAANQWRAAQDSPRDRLSTSRPDLEKELLAAGGEDLTHRIAKMVAPYMGATKKFLDFCIAFMPPAPGIRPPGYVQHSWVEADLLRSLKVIYDWRSRALHAGTPFPQPMCDPPPRLEGRYAEKPLGLASASLGAVWQGDDTPMLLRTFEHIVRGALLRWWSSMCPTINKAEDPSAAEQVGG